MCLGEYIFSYLKESFKDVPVKRCSENMQQIYRRTLNKFNKFQRVLLQILLYIFRTPFYKSTSGRLLLVTDKGQWRNKTGSSFDFMPIFE